MMDIVERLRIPVDDMFFGKLYEPVKCDAADEIEQLQDQNAELVEMLKHMVRWHDQLSVNDIAKAETVIAKATGGK